MNPVLIHSSVISSSALLRQALKDLLQLYSVYFYLNHVNVTCAALQTPRTAPILYTQERGYY